MAPQKAPRKNPNGRRGQLVLELTVHAVMGAAMGLGFCLLLMLTGRQEVVNMIAHNAEPKSTAVLLIGFTSLIFAVGATLTGMVLITLEES
jgi:hypothetical protein